MNPSPFVAVSNMFNPEEETERNWDLDLAEDVKGEVEGKYGRVKRIKVEKMSAVGSAEIRHSRKWIHADTCMAGRGLPRICRDRRCDQSHQGSQRSILRRKAVASYIHL